MLRSVAFLESQGFECTRVGVDRQGVVETLTAMTIVSVAVRLILILSLGTELMA